jgi:hypothetical protein
MPMKYFLTVVAIILSSQFYSAFGSGACLSYFGPNSRTVNTGILKIGDNSSYYFRILTPALSLPIVTIHQRNGNQVYDDESFREFQASRDKDQGFLKTPFDLGDSLILERLSHESGTTRFDLKKRFVIPADQSQIEISYTLAQDSAQVGSHSRVHRIAYKLLKPGVPLPAGNLISDFDRLAAGNILLRAVFNQGGSKIIGFDLSVSDILYHQNDSKNQIEKPVVNDVEFIFSADGFLHKVIWWASDPLLSPVEGDENHLRERYGSAELFVLAELLKNSRYRKDWSEIKKWSAADIYSAEVQLIFKTIFGGDLISLTGFSPNFVQRIALSANRKQALDIRHLLRLSPSKK